MGDFMLKLSAVGGHGCEPARKAQLGEVFAGCGRIDCPDCWLHNMVEQFTVRFGQPTSAVLIHWPHELNKTLGRSYSKANEVRDDLAYKPENMPRTSIYTRKRIAGSFATPFIDARQEKVLEAVGRLKTAGLQLGQSVKTGERATHACWVCGAPYRECRAEDFSAGSYWSRPGEIEKMSKDAPARWHFVGHGSLQGPGKDCCTTGDDIWPITGEKQLRSLLPETVAD